MHNGRTTHGDSAVSPFPSVSIFVTRAEQCSIAEYSSAVPGLIAYSRIEGYLSVASHENWPGSGRVHTVRAGRGGGRSPGSALGPLPPDYVQIALAPRIT